MVKKMLGLGSDGRLVLKLPGGQVQSIPEPERAFAYLLVDCSSSMAGFNISQAKEGALAFAEKAVKQHYLVGLIRFADSAEILSQPQDGLAVLGSRLHRLDASGGTNMSDALDLATRELIAISGVRAIVIATDGAPNSKESTITAAKRAKAAGIDIIAIGTEDADHDFLSTLVTRSDLAVKVTAEHLRRGIADATKLLPNVSRAHR